MDILKFIKWYTISGVILAVFVVVVVGLLTVFGKNRPNGLTKPITWIVAFLAMVPILNLWILGSIISFVRNGYMVDMGNFGRSRLTHDVILQGQGIDSRKIQKYELHSCNYCKVFDPSSLEVEENNKGYYCVTCTKCSHTSSNHSSLQGAISSWNKMNPVFYRRRDNWLSLSVFSRIGMWFYFMINDEPMRQSTMVKAPYRKKVK